MAAALSEERDTIEDVYEPYLMQMGFLQRTPRGRCRNPSSMGAFRASSAPGILNSGRSLERKHVILLVKTRFIRLPKRLAMKIRYNRGMSHLAPTECESSIGTEENDSDL